MSSFAGSITALFVAGMVGGYAGLCLLGPTDETQTITVAAAPIPDPPAVPCSMQAWPNADRKCLDWTAPRADVAGKTRTDGAQKAVASAPSPDKRAAGGQPSTVGMSRRGDAAGCGSCSGCASHAGARQRHPRSRPRPSRARPAHAKQTKALAVMRGFGDNLNDVRLNAYASDGSSRRSATRSAQDRSYFGNRSGGWWW